VLAWEENPDELLHAESVASLWLLGQKALKAGDKDRASRYLGAVTLLKPLNPPGRPSARSA
jgi:hypothetical protein